MKRLRLTILFYAALCCGPASAGDIILHLPDDKIHQALEEGPIWHHLLKEGDVSPEDKLTRLANYAIAWFSGDNYKSLESIGGSVEIRYDVAPPVPVP